MFTEKEVQQINAAIAKRFRERLGLALRTERTLLSRRDGLTVSEGICPHCRKPMNRMTNEGRVIRWKCEKCQSIYRIVDPRDEIDRLTGGR